MTTEELEAEIYRCWPGIGKAARKEFAKALCKVTTLVKTDVCFDTEHRLYLLCRRLMVLK